MLFFRNERVGRVRAHRRRIAANKIRSHARGWHRLACERRNQGFAAAIAASNAARDDSAAAAADTARDIRPQRQQRRRPN